MRLGNYCEYRPDSAVTAYWNAGKLAKCGSDFKWYDASQLTEPGPSAGPTPDPSTGPSPDPSTGASLDANTDPSAGLSPDANTDPYTGPSPDPSTAPGTGPSIDPEPAVPLYPVTNPTRGMVHASAVDGQCRLNVAGWSNNAATLWVNGYLYRTLPAGEFSVDLARADGVGDTNLVSLWREGSMPVAVSHASAYCPRSYVEPPTSRTVWVSLTINVQNNVCIVRDGPRFINYITPYELPENKRGLASTGA